MVSVCVFGASSTWGAWDSEKGGWVNRLRLFLEANDYDVDVYNLGVSGDTTNELLERFEVEAEAREPAIILVSIGDNDACTSSANGKHKVLPEKFEKNIKRLIELARKFTDKIAFLGSKPIDEAKTMPVPWDREAFYSSESLKEYDKMLKTLTKENNAEYIDISGLLSIKDLEDGLHPNEEGHRKLFGKVKDFLLSKRWISKEEV